MSLAPGTRLGPYDVLSPLGVGGMGEVYRARDTRLNRDVAIKVLPAAFTATASVWRGSSARRSSSRSSTILTRPRHLEAFYDVARDGRSFVVVKGHGAGTSDVVVADGLLTSAAIGGRK